MPWIFSRSLPPFKRAVSVGRFTVPGVAEVALPPGHRANVLLLVSRELMNSGTPGHLEARRTVVGTTASVRIASTSGDENSEVIVLAFG